MEDCKACRVPLGFLSFSEPLPALQHPNFSSDSQADEPEPVSIDSALVRDAFRPTTGTTGLAVETTELKRDGTQALEIVDIATRYGVWQPNCIAVGITNGVRGAVVGSVFGGAMGKLTLSFRVSFDPS